VSRDSFNEVGHRLLLGSMAFAVFLAITANAMLGPLLVDMAEALSVSVPVAVQLVTTAAAAWAVMALVAGPFSDAYGRKPVLILGTCCLAAGSLGMAMVRSFAVVAGFSILVGVGGGMVPTTCIALIGDIFPEPRKAMSIAIITMQMGVSIVLGVSLAAVLADFAGWRTPLLVLGMALLLASLILFMLVPYQRPLSVRVNLMGRLRHVAMFPTTWHMAGADVLSRVSWGVIITFFPAFLIVTFGMKTAEVALPVAMVALWATAGSILGGKIGNGAKRLTVTAGLLLAAAVPGLGVFFLEGEPWASVSMAGLFVLLTVPVTTVLLILVAEISSTTRGALTGITSCSNYAGTAVGAAIGGVVVAQFGFGALSGLLVGAILASGLLMVFTVNDKAAECAREHFSKSLDATGA
jgi:predicted MFS family arabinose efflux permease